ncbi:MAG: thioredoxin-dependent thiol peroxidase [Patescibacteria group bacterium]
MNKLKIGDKAPQFTLKDSKDESVSLSSYKGQNVVLYFYPKDGTPGCTIEAQKFRNDYKEYLDNNTEIVGISVDSEKSHESFCTKYELPFTLLSDENKEVVKLYGVWKKKLFSEETSRVTFLIDDNQVILNIWWKVNVTNHSKEVLDFIKNKKNV